MQQTGISSADGPQLKGARLFSFEELKKCTNGFSEANNIGSGGYGQVNFDPSSFTIYSSHMTRSQDRSLKLLSCQLIVAIHIYIYI
jgi:hypothetical protein